MNEFCGLSWDCYAAWLNSSVGAAWVQVLATLAAMYATYQISNRAHQRDIDLRILDAKKKQDEIQTAALVTAQRLIAIFSSVATSAAELDQLHLESVEKGKKYAEQWLPALKRHLDSAFELEKFPWPDSSVMVRCIGLGWKIETAIGAFEEIVDGELPEGEASGLFRVSKSLEEDMNMLKDYFIRYTKDPSAPWAEEEK
jgi:hypothetical protein